jgi:hypothetical protein
MAMPNWKSIPMGMMRMMRNAMLLWAKRRFPLMPKE